MTRIERKKVVEAMAFFMENDGWDDGMLILAKLANPDFVDRRPSKPCEDMKRIFQEALVVGRGDA